MIQLQYCHSLKYLFIKNGRSSGSKNLSYCNHLQSSIYFDYNAPILTEAFNTEITSLGIKGAVITNTLFVNPVQDHIRFSEKVDKITLFDMLGRIVADLNVHSDHADLSLAKFRNLLNPRQN
jgi:hypothetical protein